MIFFNTFMDLAQAQATADLEGLVLVCCAGNSTGLKGVRARGNGFLGSYEDPVRLMTALQVLLTTTSLLD